MRIRLAIPDRYVSAPVLDAALEATTQAATAQMRAGDAPTFSQLMRSGVRWRPEAFEDGEHFDLPAVIGERGWGDCDDLSSALAAELRATGQDTGAVARVVRSGPERWHAIVQLSDGRILDPSRMAGMRSNRGLKGAIASPMAAVGESAMAVAPHQGRWFVRTDVPWGDAHVASIGSSRDLDVAMDRSIVGAIDCGACIGWSHSADRQVLGELFARTVEHDARELSKVARAMNHDPAWQNCGTCGPWIARF